MYLDKVNETTKEYFNILCPDIPEFLNDYIETKEMQRIGGIGLLCGTDYGNIFKTKFYFSRLDHCIAVALIIWSLTKDKKQTLAGLFHDIAAPTFSHVVDYMNEDYINQESIEEKTTGIITNSKEIMALLTKDGISIDEVIDYKIYPIADNKKPKLSADRFEYSVSTRLIWDKTFTLADVKYIWSDITVLENEDGIIEMGFNHVKNAEKLVETACYTAKSFQLNENKLSLQFLADLLKKMIEKKLVTYDELYTIDETELINRITNSNEAKIKEIWEYYTKMDSVLKSDEIVPGKYCIGFKVKGRFINPLVKVHEGIKRIYDVSMNSKTMIDVLMNYKDTPYAYIDYSMEEEKSED